MKVFKDRYGRFMRIVWTGINYMRLQDNHGTNYIIKISKLQDIL